MKYKDIPTQPSTTKTAYEGLGWYRPGQFDEWSCDC